jgi:hypothetical protein
LRVYHLSKPCIVNTPTDTGSFYWTKSEDIVNHASENDIPVVSAASFSQRKSLILSGNISPYQNIEALQFQCENISETNQDIENLNHDIKQFLGWYSVPPIPKLDKSLDWIKTITTLGDRSIELEDKELYDILIELSSPLTGYLGRIKEDFWKKDRFYYLRDLPIN